MGLKIPKVMIAAVKSGSGKTTVTCAFLKQLLCRKKHPVSFKCGPDYIDPMFHEQVLKIPSKNLDTFFQMHHRYRRYMRWNCRDTISQC